jgi:hypothetical protein
MSNRIINSDKMYIGRYYLINFENWLECGKLINCNHTDYGFSIYFLIGNAYYNSSILQDQVHQYHIQHENFNSIRVNFYDYYMDVKIQNKIKLYPIIKLICKIKKIPYDIQRIIELFI